MDIAVQHRYKASLKDVVESLSCPKYITKKYIDLGAQAVNVDEHDCNEDGGRIAYSYKSRSPDDLPGPLKMLAQEWTLLKHAENWVRKADEWHCDYTVELEDVPVKLSGSMHLRAEGEGCVNDLQLNITCPIPLIGPMIEEFVSKDSERQIEEEYQYIKAFLKA